jgi:hypothetical protein
MSFKYFDLLGSGINLRLNNQSIIQTNTGAVLTIFLGFVTILFSWLIGKDIIYKERPFSFQQVNILDNYPVFKMNSTSFPIAVAVQDFDGATLKIDNYLDLNFMNTHYKVGEDGLMQRVESIPLQLKNCNYSDFPEIKTELFDSLGMRYALCPVNFDVEVFGYWSTPELKTVEIYLGYCDKKSNLQCKNKKEIENFLIKNSASLTLYYLDTQIILNNYHEPISKVVSVPYTFAQPGNFKIKNFMVREDKIETDNGYFFESSETIRFLKIKDEQSDTSGFNDSEYLVNFSFYSSNKYTLSYRKYIRITEILAIVGGLFKFISVFCNFINFHFSEVEKDLIIMNSIYEAECKQIFKIPKSGSCKNVDLIPDSRIGYNKSFMEDRTVFYRNNIRLQKVKHLPTNINMQSQMSQDISNFNSRNLLNLNPEVNKPVILNSDNTFAIVNKIKWSLSLLQKLKVIIIYSFKLSPHDTVKDRKVKKFFEESIKVKSELDIIYILNLLNDLKKFKNNIS